MNPRKVSAARVTLGGGYVPHPGGGFVPDLTQVALAPITNVGSRAISIEVKQMVFDFYLQESPENPTYR